MMPGKSRSFIFCQKDSCRSVYVFGSLKKINNTMNAAAPIGRFLPVEKASESALAVRKGSEQ